MSSFEVIKNIAFGGTLLMAFLLFAVYVYIICHPSNFSSSFLKISKTTLSGSLIALALSIGVAVGIKFASPLVSGEIPPREVVAREAADQFGGTNNNEDLSVNFLVAAADRFGGTNNNSSYALADYNPDHSVEESSSTSDASTRQFTVMALNAEWLWDSEEPHDGQVCEKKPRCIPSEEDYNKKLDALKEHISPSADIVGLSEIENKKVATDLEKKLGEDWNVAFLKGRDTYTGQDVALLVKEPFEIDEKSKRTFKKIKGTVIIEGGGSPAPVEIKKKPSKVLGVKLRRDGETYYVIVTHLLSRMRLSNNLYRQAQADAIRKSIRKVLEENDGINHFIVLGDLNDFRGSQVLERIRGLDDEKCPQLQQFAKDDRQIYSYEYRGNKQLIDHILVDPSLAPVRTTARDIKDASGNLISDHKSVQVTVTASAANMCN